MNRHVWDSTGIRITTAERTAKLISKSSDEMLFEKRLGYFWNRPLLYL